jgi:RNA polymerase sigma-70 factor, ECF subfamily
MTITLPLDAFTDALPAALRESFRAEGQALAETLARLVQDGEQAHSGVRVPPATFLAYLAARLSAEDPALARRDLDTLAVSDLYLACACVHGDPMAASLLESRLRRRAVEALRRLNLPR